MATKVILKKSSEEGKVPLGSQLDPGELAVNLFDRKLYTKRVDGTVIQVGGRANQGFEVKNQTGALIPKGTLLGFAGTLGASGKLLAQPFIGNGTYPSDYILGVAEEAIPDGGDGFAVDHGTLKNIDTSAWPDGTILYASSTISGALTSTQPQAPNNKITVAAVIYSSATTGSIEIRIQPGSSLENDELVQLSTLANNDVIAYNSTTGRFENKQFTVPSADKLTTARTISLTGAVTGSVSFDGSQNVSIATTHTSDPVITLTGDVTGSGTMTNLGSVSITATVADDSHNHIISNVDGLQTALDAKMFLFNGTNTGDYDLLTTNGVWRGQGGANGPSGTTHSTLITALENGSYGWQLASTGAGVYIRDKTTAWGPWKTLIDSNNYTTYSPTLTGTGATGTWGISVTGSAATLTTARTINGTSFNGSANITTANWGTTRNITIGNTTRSVNGSAAVSWSLSEIGALPLSGGTLTGNLSVTGSESRAINLVLPSNFNGTGYSNLIERINFPWYSEYWDIGVRRGDGMDIQSMEWWLNGSTKLMELTRVGNLVINGSLLASSKSFLIPHPTKSNKKLCYGSLEGPEHGVYVRGKLNGNVIELPEYWSKLVDQNSITVQLTPIGKYQKLYVRDIRDNKVFVENASVLSGSINCFYFIQAERIDIDTLQVEIE